MISKRAIWLESLYDDECMNQHFFSLYILTRTHVQKIGRRTKKKKDEEISASNLYNPLHIISFSPFFFDILKCHDAMLFIPSQAH